MLLTPGTCYQVSSTAIPTLLTRHGEYHFIVRLIHANDTSDSAIFELVKVLPRVSIRQEADTRRIVETHADGVVLRDVAGRPLNFPPFEKESVFQQWLQQGLAVRCDCNRP